MENKFDKTKLILPGAILIAAVLISGSIFYVNGGLPNKNSQAQINQGAGGADDSVPVDVAEDNDSFLGEKNAEVVIIEFSDFQCPFCRSFWRDTLPLIKKEYIDTGKVKLVYRDFPLSFHPAAHPAAQAAECAKDQDKFWEMHDKIFSEQEKMGSGTIQFTVNDIKKWAGQIGLNTGDFDQCLDSESKKGEVEKDTADGSNAGVNGTPAFFINGRKLVGAQPFAVFKAAIEEEISSVK
ncbi:MAG: DsbA family protein [Candidatus Yanofskybacteria bacterium]|nr:DsbA family protein [Candidatus Yanofskybacteria bacterium]